MPCFTFHSALYRHTRTHSFSLPHSHTRPHTFSFPTFAVSEDSYHTWWISKHSEISENSSDWVETIETNPVQEVTKFFEGKKCRQKNASARERAWEWERVRACVREKRERNLGRMSLWLREKKRKKNKGKSIETKREKDRECETKSVCASEKVREREWERLSVRDVKKKRHTERLWVLARVTPLGASAATTTTTAKAVATTTEATATTRATGARNGGT